MEMLNNLPQPEQSETCNKNDFKVYNLELFILWTAEEHMENKRRDKLRLTAF